MAFKATEYSRKLGLIGLCTATLLASGSLYAEGSDNATGPRHHGDCMGEHGWGGHQGHHGRPDGERFDMMADGLELTAQQRDKIEAIMASARAESERLHEAAREARMAVHAALDQGESDRKVRALVRQAADRNADLMLHGRETRVAVDALLTDEQKAKKQAWHEQMKQRRDERREKHMMRPREG